MSAWLITGGAGFIGSNFVRLAAARDAPRMVVLDALTYAGDLTAIVELIDAGRIDFVRGDICDARLLAELFARHRFSHVVHFAAESHVDRSIDGPLPFMRTNVEGTCRLLEAARAAWADGAAGRLFLHVSTDEVFGDLGPDDPPFTEASPYRPSSPYSASKAASDHLVRAWARTWGLPAAIANCSNNYGPWQHPEKLIPLMALNALAGRELPVYGDGLNRRDWLHVEDCCEALLAILASGRAGESWAIGGGEERSNLDIVRLICAAADEIAGRPPGTAEKLIRFVPDRPGHDRRYATNSAKLAATLAWRRRRRLAEALPATVRWYRARQIKELTARSTVGATPAGTWGSSANDGQGR
jgi:dTDP-glucose 4,6-dehydratase